MSEQFNYVARTIDALSAAQPGLPPELVDLYVLLVLTKGEDVSLEDVHDAWAVWRNRTVPDHRSLVPFDQLSPEVQALDQQYADRIVAAFRSLAAVPAVTATDSRGGGS